MTWMILPLRRYAQFGGRSRRKEFWAFVLFLLLGTILFTILDNVLGLGGRTEFGPPAGTTVGIGARASGGVLTGIFGLAMLVPNVAVQVRRLHDTDRSGWWVLVPIAGYFIAILMFVAGVASTTGVLAILGGLVAFIAFCSAVALFVFFCLDGTRGPNRFGADSKDPSATADLEDVFR